MLAAEPQTLHDLAEGRLRVYGFVRALLNKPTPEQHTWMQQNAFRGALELACTQFDLPCPTEEEPPAAYGDFESRYLACFEVGLPAPPVALQASAYNRKAPAPSIIHENVLFYQCFRLPPQAEREPADHLLHQLAFLMHLDQLLLAGTAAAASLLLARRDFLQRQMLPWLPKAAADAAERHLPALYCTLLLLLAKALQQDLELTTDAAGQQPLGEP